MLIILHISNACSKFCVFIPVYRLSFCDGFQPTAQVLLQLCIHMHTVVFNIKPLLCYTESNYIMQKVIFLSNFLYPHEVIEKYKSEVPQFLSYLSFSAG